MTRRTIPWLKIFLDNDTRYTQFLCPSLADNSGVSLPQQLPLVPPGGPTTPPHDPAAHTPPPTADNRTAHNRAAHNRAAHNRAAHTPHRPRPHRRPYRMPRDLPRRWFLARGLPGRGHGDGR